MGPLAGGDVPTGSLTCGQGQGGSAGPVAGRDEGTATLHHGDARPEPAFPRRKPGGLLAARNNGIREESVGGEFAFFPFKFPYLGFDRALWGPQCRLISFCVPFLMLHLVMVY